MPLPVNISASRGAAILGISKWSTETEIWLRMMEERQPGFCVKNNYAVPEKIEGAQLDWGHAFESAIIELAESKNNCKIIDREHLYKNGKYDFITCHIDGNYFNGGGDLIGLHEGKTTSIFYFKDNFGEPGTDKVPIEYQCQCQHQMACTGADEVILSVLVFPKRVDDWVEIGIEITDTLSMYNNDLKYFQDPLNWARILNEMGYFHQYTIKRNDELIKTMIEKYSIWWETHIINEQPPEPTNIDDIKKLFTEPVGTIIATDQVERWKSEINQCNEEIKNLKKRAEQLKKLNLEFTIEKMKAKNYVIDDDSQEKIILRGIDGTKLHTYGKNKNGVLSFR